MAAFLLAAEMGADGIELDVHLSRDGEAVVIHDDTVDATTDGHGLIRTFTRAELQSLDAGGWFGEPFSGEQIPTLAQVFESLGHRLLINVEIKVEAGYHPLEQEAETVRLIEDHQLVDRVIISSFSPSSLRRVRKLNPNIPLGFLYARPEPAWLPRVLGWLGIVHQAVHPHFKMVDARYIDHARRLGKRINVWTVNTETDMRRMRDLGVDGIITNYPDVLCRVLNG
jgi:glycerophosphoryl diester phosphodiesterase